jgi:hypothetical protein
VLDTLTSALGDITSSHTLLRNQRPKIALVDDSFQPTGQVHPTSTPDHILVHGELKGGVPFSFTIRGGPPFKDTPMFDWRVYCERGEIRVTGDGQLWLAPGNKVQAFDFVAQSVKDVDVSQAVGKEDVAVKMGFDAPVDNVARLYEAFADGKTDKYLDFKQSLKWADFIQDGYDKNGF